jgi:FOG: EAL domain
MRAASNALGKEIIAEFVENEKIMMILRELNIEYGQGYFLGKPVTVEKLF